MDEPGHSASIIRGMDEPGDTVLAFDLSPGQPTMGFITQGMNWDSIDRDIFRLTPNAEGVLRVSITGSGSGIDSLVVVTATTQLAKIPVGDGTKNVEISNVTRAQTTYLCVRGTATGSTHLHPYTLSASLLPTAVRDAETMLPVRTELHQNYPNPFNPATTIRFSVPHPGFAKIRIFNTFGEEVATLFSQRVDEGTYAVNWNASGIAGGVYFYRLEFAGHAETKKLLVIK